MKRVTLDKLAKAQGYSSPLSNLSTPRSTMGKIGDFLTSPVEKPGAALAQSIGGTIAGPLAGTALNAILNIPQAAIGLTGFDAGNKLGQFAIDQGASPTVAGLSAAIPAAASLFTVGGILSRAPTSIASRLLSGQLVKEVKATGLPLNFSKHNTRMAEITKAGNAGKPIGTIPPSSNTKQLDLFPDHPGSFTLTGKVEPPVGLESKQPIRNPNQLEMFTNEPLDGQLFKPEVKQSLARDNHKSLQTLADKVSAITGRDNVLIKVPRMLNSSHFQETVLALAKDPNAIFQTLGSKQPDEVAAALYTAKHFGIPIGDVGAVGNSIADKIVNITDNIGKRRLQHIIDSSVTDSGYISVAGQGVKVVPLVSHVKDLKAAQKAAEELGKKLHGKIYRTEANAQKYAGSRLADAGVEHTITPVDGGFQIKVAGQEHVVGTTDLVKPAKIADAVDIGQGVKLDPKLLKPLAGDETSGPVTKAPTRKKILVSPGMSKERIAEVAKIKADFGLSKNTAVHNNILSNIKTLLESNKAKTGEVLDLLRGQNPLMTTLIDRIKDFVADVPIQFGTRSAGVRATFRIAINAKTNDIMKREIIVAPHILNGSTSTEQIFTTLIHESLHAALHTAAKFKTANEQFLSSNKFKILRTQVLDALSKKLETLSRNNSNPESVAILSAKDNIEKVPEELITWSMTNKYVQKVLQETKVSTNKTLFNSFVTSMRKLLGLEANQHTLLSEIIDLTDKLLPKQTKMEAAVKTFATKKIINLPDMKAVNRAAFLLKGKLNKLKPAELERLQDFARNYESTLAEVKSFEELARERTLTGPEVVKYNAAQQAHTTMAEMLSQKLMTDPRAAVKALLDQSQRGYVDPFLLAHFVGAFAGGSIGAQTTDNPIEGAVVGALLGALSPALVKLAMRPQIIAKAVITTPDGTGIVIKTDGAFVKARVKMVDKKTGKEIERIKSYPQHQVFLQGQDMGPISNSSVFINSQLDKDLSAVEQRIIDNLPRTQGLNAKARAFMKQSVRWGRENLRGRDYKLSGIPVVKELVGLIDRRMKIGIEASNDHNKSLIGIVGYKNMRNGRFSSYIQLLDMIDSTARGMKILGNDGVEVKVEELKDFLKKFEQSMEPATLDKFKKAAKLQSDVYAEMFKHRVEVGLAKPEDSLGSNYFPRFQQFIPDANSDVNPSINGRQFKPRKGDAPHRKQSTFEFDRGSIHIPFYENDVLKANRLYMTRHYADLSVTALFRDIFENKDYARTVTRGADGKWPAAVKLISGQEAVLFDGAKLLKHLHIEDMALPSISNDGVVEKLLLTGDNANNIRVYVRRDLAEGLQEHFKYMMPKPVVKALRSVTRLWKEAVLHPAVVGLGYDVLNLLGDAERLALFNPGAFTKIREAGRIAWYIKHKKLDMRDFIEQAKGPLKDSGEIPSIAGPMTAEKMDAIANFMVTHGIAGGGYHEIELSSTKGSSTLSHALAYRRGTDRAKAFAQYVSGREFISKVRGMREDVLRIASALKIMEYAETDAAKFQKVIDRLMPVGTKQKLAPDGTVIRRGSRARADYQHAVMELLDNDRKDLLVAKLARESMIDYADFSSFEQQYLKGLMIPFWSFMKGNAVGLSRIAVNDPKQLVYVATATIGMTHLYNEAFFPELEKTLKPYQQARPHLWLPRPIRWKGNSPYVAVGYSSILNDFFENLMLFNGIQTIEDTARKGSDAFVPHAQQALSRLLNKADFAITPLAGIPVSFSPILNSITHQKPITAKQWLRFANNVTIKVLPGGRMISRMFKDNVNVQNANFSYHVINDPLLGGGGLGLGRFAHDKGHPTNQ